MSEYLEEIYNFWLNNDKYWINTNIIEKIKIDKIIYDKYYNIGNNIILNENYSIKQLVGYIIYNDQFYKHFNRHLNIQNESNVKENREKILILLNKFNNYNILTDFELIFTTIVYKHMNELLKVINIVNNWCKYNNIQIKDNRKISKYYNDTFEKYYCNLQNIKNKIEINSLTENKINYSEICDYISEDYKNNSILLNNIEFNLNITNNIHKILETKRIIVSLSGGVDSMVMLYYLKKLNNNTEAVHIMYNNRKECEEEYKFLNEYCKKLNVKLYLYKIENLKRKEIEREYYEKVTRIIRFNVYKILEADYIALGHIKDDKIENIWTNIVNCVNLENLEKIDYISKQNEVSLIRPFINIEKEIIYKISEKYNIPYLKDTTPVWSNRGKFRNNFYNSIKQQYGNNYSDDKIIEFSNILKNQNNIINELIYLPIYNSYNNNKIIIDNKNIKLFDVNNWSVIFGNICYNILKISKPSINSIINFIEKINRKNKKIILKKTLEVEIKYNNQNIELYFIIKN